MQKFVVVGIQRSGTTLIQTSLDSHPRVRCDSEIFKVRTLRMRKQNRGEYGYPVYREQALARRIGHWLWRGPQTRRYLDWFYSQPGYDALGFKLMLNQARLFPAIVPYLQRHQVRIIQVVRRNVLKKLVSVLTARARGQFHSTDAIGVTRIHVPTGKLFSYLDRFEAENRRWQELFEHTNPYLRIEYESFVADKDGHCRRMLDFLDVEQADIASSLVKLNPDDLSLVIENYDEVARMLRGTRYEKFLSGN